MKQKRLEAICSFLTKEDNIIDIGCDHAYVCIEMAHRGATKILATDIHPNALEYAKKNIVKHHVTSQIHCQLSDGLKEVATKGYDTLVIAGMGTSTILHILEDKEKLKPIKKIILQSNNECNRLRQTMIAKGFELVDEIVIYEKKHYYTIMKWVTNPSSLTEEEIEFGIYKKENQEYYHYLYQKEEKILKSIPFMKWHQRKKQRHKLKMLKKYQKKD